MDKITDERLREIVDKTYCRLDEGEEMAAELLALRSRVGWLDHLDTPEGRAMHATEAVRVENEQLRARFAVLERVRETGERVRKAYELDDAEDALTQEFVTALDAAICAKQLS